VDTSTAGSPKDLLARPGQKCPGGKGSGVDKGATTNEDYPLKEKSQKNKCGIMATSFEKGGERLV